MTEKKDKIINQNTVKRRMKQSKMKRKVRHTQRKIKVLRILLKIILILFICFACYHIIYMKSWRLPKDIFYSNNTQALSISNNRIVPTHKVLAYIRHIEIPNKAIFLIDIKEVKNSLLRLEPVKDVYVRRLWMPARLNIIIIERTPAILIAQDEKSQPVNYFTDDGKLIGQQYLPLKSNYKMIKVLAYPSREDDYRRWDIKQQNYIKKISKIIETYSNEKIEYIDLRNVNDVYIKLPSVMLRLGQVNQGNLNLTMKRLSKLPSLLPQVKLLNKKIKYLDLRWDRVYYIKLDE